MDNFILDVSGTGAVEVYVGLDPDTVGPGSYTWKAVSRGGLAQLAIATTDRNFHMGTWYYIYLRAIEEALVTLELKQQRSVEFIPNNHDFTYQLTYRNANLLYQKFQFQSVKEQAKFHAFTVPGATKRRDGTINYAYYRVKITIDALTPHFYPRVYIKKQERYNAPASLAEMEFPSVNDYLHFFGDDPYSQIHSTHFEYEFTNISSAPWVFITMAVYQHNWGLTDQRKSEYQIRVFTDMVDQCEAVYCEGS
jgi:hypothetical protein